MALPKPKPARRQFHTDLGNTQTEVRRVVESVLALGWHEKGKSGDESVPVVVEATPNSVVLGVAMPDGTDVSIVVNQTGRL